MVQKECIRTGRQQAGNAFAVRNDVFVYEFIRQVVLGDYVVTGPDESSTPKGA